MTTRYPKRDRFFAHHFVRVLFKSCAAQDIGRDSCYLLTVIAHTEDAARYSGPVRFWNSQLMETMAFRSPKQLRDARQRAVDFGWLKYWRKSNRSVGHYFVTIPERFEGITDAPIEPNGEAANPPTWAFVEGNHSANRSAGEHIATGNRPAGEHIPGGIVPLATQLSTESVPNSVHTSNPSPFPNPEEHTHTRARSPEPSNPEVGEWLGRFADHVFAKTGRKIPPARLDVIKMELARIAPDKAVADLKFSILKDAVSVLDSDNDFQTKDRNGRQPAGKSSRFEPMQPQ